MCEAQRERDWETVSHLMALLANINRSKKGKPFTADQFNPTVTYRTQQRKVLPYSRETMEMAKTFFNALGKK
jgi:hypothetical protein